MDREALEGLTRKALVEMARDKGLAGYSSLAKPELVDALEAVEKKKPAKASKLRAVEKSRVVPASRRESAADLEVVVPAGTPEKIKVTAGEAAEAPDNAAVKAVAHKKAAKAKRAEKSAKAEKPAAKSEKAAKPQEPARGVEPAMGQNAAKGQKTGRGKKPAVPAGHEPKFKPAEAYLDSSDDAGDQPAVPAGGQFKKTSKVDDLLAVDTALGELPPTYDENRAVLLVRDPQWAYAYWDLERTLIATTKGDYRQILRVQELSGAAGRPAYFFDVPVPRHARSWYLKLPGDGRRYRVEVGLHYRDGSYAAVTRSNEIEMPRAKPSEVVADKFVTLPLETEPEVPAAPVQQQSYLPPVAEWMVAPESAGVRAAAAAPPAVPAMGQPAPTFKELGGPALYPETDWGFAPPETPWSGSHPLSPELVLGAPGLSGPVSSHAVTSWGFAPGASEQLLQPPKAKDFWLVADAELIVYGATEPDAKVTLRGEAVQLRPDGTFSFRFYLPDGLHPIPIRALNADEDDERLITITVSRGTQGDGKQNLREG